MESMYGLFMMPGLERHLSECKTPDELHGVFELYKIEGMIQRIEIMEKIMDMPRLYFGTGGSFANYNDKVTNQYQTMMNKFVVAGAKAAIELRNLSVRPSATVRGRNS